MHSPAGPSPTRGRLYQRFGDFELAIKRGLRAAVASTKFKTSWRLDGCRQLLAEVVVSRDDSSPRCLRTVNTSVAASTV